MDHPDERREHVRHGAGHADRPRMNMNFSIWIGAVTVAIYVMLGGLRSAIINRGAAVLLIWAGAALIQSLASSSRWLDELKAQIAHKSDRTTTLHLWTTLAPSRKPDGIHWTGMVLGLERSSASATGPPTFSSCSGPVCKHLRPPRWLQLSVLLSKMAVRYRHRARPHCALGLQNADSASCTSSLVTSRTRPSARLRRSPSPDA